MTTDPTGAEVGPGELGPGDDLVAGRDRSAARHRHPSAHPWRTDHDALAVRLAAHLEAAGWPAAAAHDAALEAKAAARRG